MSLQSVSVKRGVGKNITLMRSSSRLKKNRLYQITGISSGIIDDGKGILRRRQRSKRPLLDTMNA